MADRLADGRSTHRSTKFVTDETKTIKKSYVIHDHILEEVDSEKVDKVVIRGYSDWLVKNYNGTMLYQNEITNF